MISTPILLVLLVIIFGSLVSALLPLTIGGVAILGAFTALRVLTSFTDVSTFAINIVTMLGLGLAIDYALFIVTRYREELGRTDSEREALARTMATAGRTVAFSGITVAIALGGLLFFPQMFLRSMGLGGMAVVLVDMLAALTILPALLALLGRRVDALRLVRRRPPAPDRGAWFRLAHSVMRRPVLYAVGSAVVLLALGAPFLGIRFGSVDVRSLPPGAEARTVAATLDRDFAHGSLSPIDVVVAGTSRGPTWTPTSAACAPRGAWRPRTSSAPAATPCTSRCAPPPTRSPATPVTWSRGSGRCPRPRGRTSAVRPRSCRTC